MKKREIEDGGPAFPVSLHRGMDLRDYFAAKAMQAICMADAMLIEREK